MSLLNTDMILLPDEVWEAAVRKICNYKSTRPNPLHRIQVLLPIECVKQAENTGADVLLLWDKVMKLPL